MTEAEITEFLFLEDPPGRSDLAIVFGHEDPELSGRRVRHAASLYLESLTPRLLLTGGVTGQCAESEAQHMAKVVKDSGVPGVAMLLETRSRTTLENLALSIRLLTQEKLLDSIRTVHLVSCPWHMRRLFHLAGCAFGHDVRLLSSPHRE